MKLAKFVYPMFLVAIGLHGLLLFVPMGGASDAELIEEDVALSELPTTADPKAKSASSESASALPVPNLNISTGATATTPAKSAAAARTAATPRAAARPPAAAARRTATTQAGARSAPGSAAQGRTGTSAGSGTSSAGSTSSSAASGATENRSSAPPRTNLPNLAASNPSSTEQSGGSTGSGGTTGSNLTLSGLIASVTKSAPDALESLRSGFVEDYTYDDKDTDAAGLEERRSRWIDKISLLANADSSASGAVAEKIEPIVLSDSKLSYPIERSARSDRRASRICLDDPPPNDAEVAVLFDAQGNVVGTPEMTRSSGYQAIDREIIAIVLAEGGANASDSEASLANRQSKAYLRAFEIDYAAERCLTLPKLKK